MLCLYISAPESSSCCTIKWRTCGRRRYSHVLISRLALDGEGDLAHEFPKHRIPSSNASRRVPRTSANLSPSRKRMDFYGYGQMLDLMHVFSL